MSDSGEIRSLVVMCRRLDRAHGGAALRNLQNVRALARLGPVDVISVGPSDPAAPVEGVDHYEHIARQASAPALQRLWSKRWVVSPTAHPMVSALYQESVVAAIRRRFQSDSYDVAVVEELGLARYLEDLNRGGCVTIFDAHNLESSLSGDMAASQRAGLAARWKRSLMDRRLAAAERYFAQAADRVWACSTLDQQGFAGLMGNATPVDVIPNAIDVPAYEQADRRHEAEDWRDEPMLLTYLGAYSYYPNEEAALELIQVVLPLLRDRGIPARLQLIGANPTPAMKAAAKGLDDVEITGAVDSVMPYLKQRCLIVLPLRLGGGTRLKILEAFAASRPVISTAKGAEGIEAVDGTHLLIRESAADLAEAAATLWTDRETRARLCRNALQLVTDRYSLESTAGLIRNSVLDTLESISPQSHRIQRHV
jgi:glycosyltransferase involved in cell wall biosynthesis